jgi:hypothetical protein
LGIVGPARAARTLHVAVIAAVWIAVRLAFFNGYYTEDSPGYVSDAIAIATGEYQPRNHVNGLNVGTYAPVAVPLWVMGKSEIALSLWPLTCSALGVVSIACLSTVLFGWGFGVLAAFLYATYPGDVFFSTVVMPDAVQSGWLTFSLALAILACRGRPKRTSQLLVCAGAAMGVCHLVRANGSLLLPVGVSSIAFLTLASGAYWRTALRRITLYLIGWVFVLGAEAMAYRSAVGDFLFRVHVVEGHYGNLASIQQFGLNTHPLTIPYSAFAPLLWTRLGGWGNLNQDQAYHALLFTSAVAMLLIALATLVARRSVQRDAPAAWIIAVVWIAWPLVYHQFGSQSLTQFVPIHRLSRHLVVYAPGAIFAIVAGSYIVWSAVHRRSSRIALTIAAASALLIHLLFNIEGELISYEAYHRIKSTYSRMRERLPADTRLIVADPGDLGFFDFWLNPLGESRVELHAFARYANCAALRTGIVLTYSNPGWERLNAPVIQETVARLPCLLTPPVHWRPLYEGYPERIYAIDK